ncbi:MAG: Glycosyl transferase, family 39, partial [Parcubacteria group bacterium GW2011_GWC2_42_6]
MSKKITYPLAALMLIFMLYLSFSSMLGDSAIIDEVAHLPAGYSYITQQDMRLNPEHPPLVKDLAGASVWLWSKISGETINFPDSLPSWQKDINGQWDFGFNFIYNSCNNADAMIFFGRIPTLLLLLILGIYVFKWARELYGPFAGLLALFLYSFSPTFLAHGRFVTTDVAAAAAIFISSYYFVKWLKNPSVKNLIIAGLIFGLAQLAKFSVFLIVPLFAFIALIWLLAKSKNSQEPLGRALLKNAWKYLGGTVALMAIGCIFIILPVYFYHIINYPVAKQQADIKFILSSFGIRIIPNTIYWLAGIPVLRALAEYGLGLAMVMQRAAGGNTTYFLGEISNLGWKSYFPLVYLMKETLTLHILTLLALFVFTFNWLKNYTNAFKEKINWSQTIEQKIAPILMLSFLALYWWYSIRTPLNIGVRHVLPTFAFIFILVAGQIASWFKKPADNLPAKKSGLRLKYILLSGLIVWQIVSVISVYPSFLAYFNEAVGGPANGYKYVTDSNLDWGQDMKRLAQWTEENNVNKIYLDYFGGATTEYYLGDKFMPWHCSASPTMLKSGDWLAVSATFLQGGRG